MKTKQEIVAALELAIADHKATAKSCTDWDFIESLLAARAIVEAAENRSYPIPRR